MADQPPQSPHDKLLIARAKAIQAYAVLEQSLGKLFAYLLGVPEDYAGIVFFRITSARNRNQIVEHLLDKKFESAYDAYWHGLPGSPGNPKTGGLLSIIRQLDDTRNQVVHWQTMTSVGGAEQTSYLIRPNLWEYITDRQSLTIAQIDEFSAKTDFAARSVNIFWWYSDPNFISRSGLSEADAQPWLDIIRRPCTYPISNTHPLSPNYVEQPSPPQSLGRDFDLILFSLIRAHGALLSLSERTHTLD